MSKPIPIDKKLYEKVKLQAKNKFKVYPSIYANSWVVKEYKKLGGKYSGKKSVNSGLTRWYDEMWVDVCYLPEIVRCGRETAQDKFLINYPYCRPYYRVSKQTPKTVFEFSSNELKKRCNKKRKEPLKKVI